MPDLGGGLFGCYRCSNVWRSAHSAAPRICARCKSRFWNVPVIRPVMQGRHWGLLKRIQSHRREVERLARARGFTHVRVFGSVRRGEARPGSDIDILVSPDRGASVFQQIALREDLERLLRRRVDVVTDGGLHWLIRPQVLVEALPL